MVVGLGEQRVTFTLKIRVVCIMSPTVNVGEKWIMYIV